MQISNLEKVVDKEMRYRICQKVQDIKGITLPITKKMSLQIERVNGEKYNYSIISNNQTQHIRKVSDDVQQQLCQNVKRMQNKTNNNKYTLLKGIHLHNNQLYINTQSNLLNGGGCGSSSAQQVSGTAITKQQVLPKAAVLPQNIQAIKQKAQKINRAGTIYDITDKQFTDIYKIVSEEYISLDEELQEDKEKEVKKKDNEKSNNPDKYEQGFKKIEDDTLELQNSRITNLSIKIQQAFINDNFFERFLADTKSRMQYKPYVQDLFWKNIECFLRKSTSIGEDYKSKDVILKRKALLTKFKKDCANNSKKTPLLDCIFFTELLLHIYKIYEKQYEEKQEYFMQRAKLIMNIFLLAYNVYKMDVAGILKEIKGLAEKAFKKYEQYQSEQIFDSIVDIWQIKVNTFTENRSEDEKSQFFKKLSEKRMGSEFEGFEEDEILFYMDLIVHNEKFKYVSGSNEKQAIYILQKIDYLITVNFMQGHQSNHIKNSTKQLHKITTKSESIKEFLQVVYHIHRAKINLLEMLDLSYLKRQLQFSALMVVVKLWRIFHLQYLKDQADKNKLFESYSDPLLNEMWYDICYTFASKGEPEVETIFYYSGDTLSRQLEYFFQDENNFQKLVDSFKGQQLQTVDDLKQEVFRKMIDQWIKKVQERQQLGIAQKDDVLLEVKDFYINQQFSYLFGDQNILQILPQQVKSIEQGDDQTKEQSDKTKVQSDKQENTIQENTTDQKSNNTHALQIVKESFLKQNSCKVLAVLAEGGSGKSMFLKKLELDLLYQAAESKEGDSISVPLLIKCNALNSLNPDIEDALMHGDYEMSAFNIRSLKNSHLKQKVILLDGYDEFSGEYFNIYEKLKIADWQNTKVILTSRKEKIDEVSMQKYVSVTENINGKNVTDENSFCMVNLLKFNENSVKEYYEMYFNSLTRNASTSDKSDKAKASKTQAEANQLIKIIESLVQKKYIINLIQLPINLYLLTRLMGELTADEINSNIKFQELQEQSSLQELFFEYQFEREAHGFKDILGQSQKKKFNKEQLDAIQILVSGQYNQYFQSIAMKMFLQKGKVSSFLSIKMSDIVIEINATLSKELGQKEFESKLIDRIQNYVNSQIVSKVKKGKKKEEEKQKESSENVMIEFKHKSLFEYFTAKAMLEDFEKHGNKIKDLDMKTLQNFKINQRLIMKIEQNESESQILLQLNRHFIKLINRQIRLSSSSSSSSSCSAPIQVYSYLQTYIDYIYHTKQYKTQLNIASSNLLSAILLDNKFIFENLDFSECSFPYAYLYGCKQSTINFTNANLDQAFLCESSLNVANSITLNAQKASISLSVNISGSYSGLIDLAVSQDGKYLASVGSYYLIFVWIYENNKYKFVKVIQESSHLQTTNINFTSNSKFMIVIYTDVIKLYTTKNQLFSSVAEYKLTDLQGSRPEYVLFDTKQTYLAILDSKRKCTLWNSGDGDFSFNREINAEGDTIFHINFSPNSEYFLTSRVYGNLQLRNAKDNSFDVVQSFDSFSDQFFKSAFNLDSSILLLATKKKWNIQIYQKKENEDTFSYVRVLALQQELLFIKFSLDGQYLLTAQEKALKKWKVNEAIELIQVDEKAQAHEENMRTIILTPNKSQIITSCIEQYIKIWDIENFKRVQLIGGTGASIICASVTHDWKQVTTGTEFNTIIWNIENEEYDLTQKINEFSSSSLVFNSTSQYLILASRDYDIVVLKLEEGKYILNKKLTGHQSNVTDLKFSPDQKYLVSCSDDKTCKIWDGKSEQFEFIKDMYAHPDKVNTICFSSDGQYLITGCSDNVCRVFSTANGQFTVFKEIKGFTDTFKSISINQDNKFIAFSLEDNPNCIVRNLNDLTKESIIIQTGFKSPSAIQFSSDGKYLATGCKLWNAESGKFQLEMQLDSDQKYPLSMIQFSKDGKKLMTASSDTSCKIWNLESGYELVKLPNQRQSVIFNMKISPNGKYIIIYNSDQVIEVWNYESGTFELNQKIVFKSNILCMTFSKDSQFFAIGADDFTCNIYDANSDFKLFKSWQPQGQKNVGSLSFCYKNKYFVTGSSKVETNEQIYSKLWLIEKNYKFASDLTDHSRDNIDFAFSPDNKYFTSCSQTEITISEIQKLNKFSKICTLDRYAEGCVFTQIQFTPDSQFIVGSLSNLTYSLYEKQNDKFGFIKQIEQSVIEQQPVFNNSNNNNNISQQINNKCSFAIDEQYFGISTKHKTCQLRRRDENNNFILTCETPAYQKDVQHVLFHPNNQQLITSSFDAITCQVWNRNCSQIQEIKQNSMHEKQIQDLIFSKSGKYLASISDENIIKIWMQENDQFCYLQDLQIDYQERFSTSLFFSADEQSLIYITQQYGQTAWRLDSNGKFKLKSRLKPTKDYEDFRFISVSNSCTLVSFYAFSNKYFFWDIEKDEVRKQEFESLTDFQVSVYTRDDKYLVMCFTTGKVRVVNIAAQTSVDVPLAVEQQRRIQQVELIQDDEYLIIADYDNQIYVHKREGEIYTHVKSVPIPCEEANSQLLYFNYLPSAKLVAYHKGSFDKYQTLLDFKNGDLSVIESVNIRDIFCNGFQKSSCNKEQFMYYSPHLTSSSIWDWETEGVVPIDRSKITSDSGIANFNIQSKYMAIAQRQPYRITIMKLIDQKYQVIKEFSALNSQASCLVWSHDNTLLATGCYSGDVQIWRKESDRLHQIKLFSAHSQKVNSIDYSQNGKYLVTCSNDKFIRIWNAGKSEYSLLKEIADHTEVVKRVRMSNNNKYFVSCSKDKTCRIWYLSDISLMKCIDAFGSEVSDISITTDSLHLATATFDAQCYIWKVSSDNTLLQQQIKTNHFKGITAVQFSPNNSYLATGSSDYSVIIYTKEDNNNQYVQLQVLEDHLREITSLSFRYDSLYFISSSGDNTCKVWQVQSNSVKFVKDISKHSKKINQGAFSIDGNQIATCSEDNTCRITYFDITQDFLQFNL